MKVYIPFDAQAETREMLEAAGHEVALSYAKNKAELLAEIPDADGAIVRSLPYDREVLEAAPHLKAIGRIGVGYDAIDVKTAEELGIWVGIALGANGNSVAEHTMTLMMALSKNLCLVNNHLKDGDFDIRTRVIRCELRGKSLGILGVGAIGRMVAAMAHDGFGMEIIGYDAFISPAIPPYVKMLGSAEEVLKQADFVTLHMPATPETAGMINLKTLSLMKPTAFLVNCARGAIVNEKELYEGLRDHLIAGAGLDVFVGDRPEADNPLLTLDNVIVTPHYAAYTIESAKAMERMAAQAVIDVLAGGRPKHPVNHPAATRV